MKSCLQVIMDILKLKKKERNKEEKRSNRKVALSLELDKESRTEEMLDMSSLSFTRYLMVVKTVALMRRQSQEC